MPETEIPPALRGDIYLSFQKAGISNGTGTFPKRIHNDLELLTKICRKD